MNISKTHRGQVLLSPVLLLKQTLIGEKINELFPGGKMQVIQVQQHEAQECFQKNQLLNRYQKQLTATGFY